MANALGKRLLYRYATGDLTQQQLQTALGFGWITQNEYDDATG